MAYSFKNSKGKEYFLHMKVVARASGKHGSIISQPLSQGK